MKFLRQNWFRLKRLGLKWRRPKGSQSKMRKSEKGKPRMPKVGYRTPRTERGKLPYKGEKVEAKLVHTIKEIGDAKHIIIASSVGKKKLMEFYEYCKKNGIEVVNRKKLARIFAKGGNHESRVPEKAGE